MRFSSLFLTLAGLLLALLPLEGSPFHTSQHFSLFVALVLLVGVPLFYHFVAEPKRAKFIAALVIGVIAIQAQWGVVQFVVQQDLGMYLLGESRLSLQLDGVATFLAGSEKLIRAYGPYPHANSLGGVMVLGLGLLAFTQLPFSFKGPVGFMLLLGLLVSFSRTAWLAGFLLLLLWLVVVRPNLKHIVWLFLIPIMLFIPLFVQRVRDPADVAVPDRIEGWEAAVRIIGSNSILRGSGLGRYERALKTYYDRLGVPYDPWDIAPVHSVPLLAVAEWGLAVAVAVGIGLAYVVIRVTPRSVRVTMWLWLGSLLPLLLFDHYLLTQAAPGLFFIAAILVLPHLLLTPAGE